MSTVNDIPSAETFWARLGTRLSNWGSKIKAVGKKAGNFITRAAKWLWNTPVTQWVATKSKFLLSKVWYYAKGPIGWITIPIAGIIFAPKALAIMLFAVLLLVALIAVIIWAVWRQVKLIDPEAAEEVRDHLRVVRDQLDDVSDTLQDAQELDLPLADDEVLNPDETLNERYAVLDKLHAEARDAGEADLVSELTGRLFVIQVRDGKGGKVKQDAKVNSIHIECRRRAEKLDTPLEWNFKRMWNAVRAEDKRLKDIARLKADQANLTSV